MADCYSAVEMLAKLVSFDTVSDKSNLELIAFVEDYLSGHGVSSTRVYDETGEKAALYAMVGPNVDGGIILSGHTDVVPVSDQIWASDPFTLREEDGKVYGRGAADMKGFVATVLASVPHMLSSDLKRPIHIALSYDEEVGCLGAPPMLEHLLEAGPRPAMAVVGEPTNMKAVTGHKGITFIETEVTGHAVHSSQLHRGVSAISVAAKLIAWIDAQTEHNRETTSPDNGFDPPYTTLHCGVIKGGAAHNITASECIFETDIRTIPGDVGREWVKRYRHFIDTEILPPMREISPDCDITIREMANVPGLAPEQDGAAETLVRRLTGDNGTHLVVFATEGGQFQEKGLSTVVCGPGSIDQAHKPDEFIEVQELHKCTAFIERLCSDLS